MVGWIKRGPSGVIGTNKKDAQETVDMIFEDIEADALQRRRADSDFLPSTLTKRGIYFIEYDGWRAIDELETARGSEQGRPRVKLTSLDEMIRVANSR